MVASIPTLFIFFNIMPDNITWYLNSKERERSRPVSKLLCSYAQSPRFKFRLWKIIIYLFHQLLNDPGVGRLSWGTPGLFKVGILNYLID